MQAEAADIRGKIEAEVRKVVQALRNEAAVARAREGSLAGSLDRLGAEVGRANSAEGDICARVATELDWYRWGWSGRTPSTLEIPVHLLWVE